MTAAAALASREVSNYLQAMGDARRATAVRQVELTDAALHLIATRGIAALNTRSLAAAVGLSTGAIFRHYPSLDALLEAVAERVEVVLEATYPPPGLPPHERLQRFVDARSAAVGERLGILRLLLSEQFLLALPPRASARLAACVQRSRAFVAGALAEAQAAGLVRRDLPTAALVPIVLGTVQMLALSRTAGRQRTLEGRAARLALFTLLRPPGAARRRSKKPGRSALRGHRV